MVAWTEVKLHRKVANQLGKLDGQKRKSMGSTVMSFANSFRRGRIDVKVKVEVPDLDVEESLGVARMRVTMTDPLVARVWEILCHRNGIAIAISRIGPSRSGFGWRLLGQRDTPKAH